MRQHQRGGTVLGLVLGLLVGLAAALAVAIYVTNVPVPFVNKGGVRGDAKDKEEQQRNQNWDPNSPLYGKNPARGSTPAVQGVVVPEPPKSDAAAIAPSTSPVTKPEVVMPDSKTASGDKPAADKSTDKSATKPGDKTTVSKIDTKPGQSADPLGDLAKSRGAPTGGADPYQYFVQAGAFRTSGDGEAQRAKLAMMGWEAKVTEREVNGRVVYRVRVGPFAKRDDADGLKGKLDGAGVDAQIVRVQR